MLMFCKSSSRLPFPLEPAVDMCGLHDGVAALLPEGEART